MPGRGGYAGIMTTIGENAMFTPGQKAPVSGFYTCDSGCGHRFSTNVAGHVLPPLPEGCAGRGWRLAEQRPSSGDEAAGRG
ncbi:hypothetical protein [Amycolatopsis anabasis]|uniref:hypothetical protein n=1 Tax=Amycolatopsis anabasis TaxID=1840409 RepID=UPI001C5539D9|nr:hypothetical protein [Amycolatopsis anabasis]